MDIQVSAGGQTLFIAPQQNWRDIGEIQSAIFAGQLMILGAPEASDEGFELIYLGFKSTVFANEHEAKSAAPRFAATVLEHMIERIHWLDSTQNPFTGVSSEALAREMTTSFNTSSRGFFTEVLQELDETTVKSQVEDLLNWSDAFYTTEADEPHNSESWLLRVAEILNANYVLVFLTVDDDMPLSGFIREGKVVRLNTSLKARIRRALDENEVS